MEFTCELNIDTDDVAWFLDEDKLSPSPKDGIDISKDGLQHRLSIEEVSPEDTGVVKVIAKVKSAVVKRGRGVALIAKVKRAERSLKNKR